MSSPTRRIGRRETDGLSVSYRPPRDIAVARELTPRLAKADLEPATSFPNRGVPPQNVRIQPTAGNQAKLPLSAHTRSLHLTWTAAPPIAMLVCAALSVPRQRVMARLVLACLAAQRLPGANCRPCRLVPPAN